MINRKSIGAGILVVGVVFAGIMGFRACHIIKTGYTGVIKSLDGGIRDYTLSQGFHLTNPFDDVEQYATSQQQGYLSKDSKEGSKDDESFLIPTSDGKTANVDMEYSYHFDVEKLPQTFTRFQGQDGKTIEQSFIRGKLKAWAGEESAEFSVMDIYGEKRSSLNAKVLEHVKDKFEEYGIVIDSVNFARIGLDDETNKAIQARINKQQELETAKLEAQKAEIDAKTKITQAEADAKVNETKSTSISDKILQEKFLEKWDGHLPTVTGGNGTMMDISSLMGTKK
jgi:regulator of protease activity HflC (stomatin/prohibitin superfamily)